MSFRRDVKAWAEAEVRRRMERGRSAAIESLLYPPHRSSRRRVSRAGIPPVMGIGRTPDHDWIDVVGTGQFLEHGMMWRQLPPQTVPVDVYSTAWSLGYLSGAGTATPNAPPRQYLIGEMAKSADGGIYWSTDPSYWLAYPYKSEVWTDQDQWDTLWPIEISRQSNAFSGLLRLFVQVINGGNLDPSVVFGPIYPLRPDEDGLFRMWDAALDTYSYWLIRSSVNPDYVVAHKMVLSEDSQVILEWLNAHHRGTVNLDDDTRRLYDAWVMRGMTIVSGSIIAGPAELSDLWASSAQPVAHGWNYSRQRIGSPLEDTTKASIVTHGVTTVGSPTGEYRWHAQHANLEFSLANDVVSVLVNIIEGPTDWAMITSQGPMWYPTFDGTQYQHWQNPINMVGDPTTPTADVPFYAYWGDDKEEVARFNMEYSTVEDIDTSNYGPIELCGGEGGGSRTYKNLSTLTYGGPYIVGATPASGTIDQGTRKDKTFNVSKVGEIVRGFPGSTSYQVQPEEEWFCEVPEGCWPDGWHNIVPFCDQLRNDVPGQFIYDQVRAVEEETERTTNTWSLERPLVITNDPEAVYSVFHSRITGSSTEWIWDFLSTNIAPTLTTGGEWTWDGVTYEVFKERFGSRGGYWAGGDPGVGMGPTGTDSNGDLLNPPTSETSQVIDEVTDTAVLVRADQTIALPAGSWGQYFYNVPMEPVGANVDSMRSYYDGSGYYATEPSVWLTTDGLPFSYGDGILFPLGAV